jgi:hypothetical protein
MLVRELSVHELQAPARVTFEDSKPCPRDGDQLFNDIGDDGADIPTEYITANPHPLEDRSLRQKLIIIALAGAAFQAASQAFLPITQHAPLFDLEPRSRWVGFVKQMYTLLATFPAQFVCFAIFAFFAVYRWRSPRAAIYAFFAGAGVAYVALHWLTSV